LRYLRRIQLLVDCLNLSLDYRAYVGGQILFENALKSFSPER
jgi:hypothetical protein